MIRSVWWPDRLKMGQYVLFQGKTYIVLSQSKYRYKSYHFGARFYTDLREVSK